MTKVRFVDRFNLSPTKRKMTKQGYMHVPAKIARPGIQLYRGADLMGSPEFPHDKFTKDSIVKVYRPPEEVFRQDAVASFKNVPVTNEHPPSLLDAKTTAAYQKGSVRGDVTHNQKYVYGTICITDESTIREITAGKIQVSAGYESYIDFTGGVTEDGETYDACQRDIEGNHVAIVARGRAGASVRLADAAMEVEGLKYMLPKIKVTMDGDTYEVSEGSESYNKIGWMFDSSQAEFIRENKVEQEEMRSENEDEDYNEVNAGKASKKEPKSSAKVIVKPGPDNESVAVSDETNKSAAMDETVEDDNKESVMDEKELEQLKTQFSDASTLNEELTAKLDVANAKLEEALAKIPTVDTIDEMVVERMAMLDSVRAFKPEIETAGRSTLEMKKEIVMDHFPKLTDEKATEAYVLTAFDMLDVPEAVENDPAKTPAIDVLDEALIEEVSVIGPSKKVTSAREDFMARNRDAWK